MRFGQLVQFKIYVQGSNPTYKRKDSNLKSYNRNNKSSELTYIKKRYEITITTNRYVRVGVILYM